jgi:hypothetical protein
MAYTFADPDHSIGEERWLMFGLSRMARVLAVIFTLRRGKYRILVRVQQHDMKGKLMKKAEEMRAGYRREDLGKGVRGKHFEEFKKGSNLVLLTPELSKIFPTNEAVNAALSSLVGVARSATGLTSRSSGRATKRRGD